MVNNRFSTGSHTNDVAALRGSPPNLPDECFGQNPVVSNRFSFSWNVCYTNKSENAQLCQHLRLSNSCNDSWNEKQILGTPHWSPLYIRHKIPLFDQEAIQSKTFVWCIIFWLCLFCGWVFSGFFPTIGVCVSVLVWLGTSQFFNLPFRTNLSCRTIHISLAQLLVWRSKGR